MSLIKIANRNRIFTLAGLQHDEQHFNKQPEYA